MALGWNDPTDPRKADEWKRRTFRTRFAELLWMVPMTDVLVYRDGETSFRAGGASVVATGYHVHQRATVQDLAGIRRIPGY